MLILTKLKKIDKHYNDFINEINNEGFDYINNKLSKLIDNANRYEKDSDAHKIYIKSIDMMTSAFINSITERVSSAKDTQRMIIENNQQLKNIMIQQVEILVEKTMSHAGQLINSSFMNELNQDIKKSLGHQNMNVLTHQEEEK